MIITILAFIGVPISIICAVISILNAIDSHRYYKIKKKEFWEQREKETLEKMDRYIKKYGFTPCKGRYI